MTVKHCEGNIEINCPQEPIIASIQDQLKKVYEYAEKLSVSNATLHEGQEIIKSKLDNGIKTTLDSAVKQLKETHDMLTGTVIPVQKENTKWVHIFQNMCITITTLTLAGGVIAVLFYALKSVFGR